MNVPLAELQQQFLAYLLTPTDKQIRHSIIETDKVSKQTRLAIYANAYAMRLLEGLQDNYPAVHTLLGDEAFRLMSFEYIRLHPSEHFSVRYFGHKLTSFLTQQHPNQPFLAEMANFEWQLRHAFDAKNQIAIGIEALQAIPPEEWGNMRFEWQDALSRVDFAWNTPQLWQAIDENAAPIPPQQQTHPIGWRIWRSNDFRTLYRSLDVDEAWALDALMSGKCFAQVCEGLCEWVDEAYAPNRAIEFIIAWISDGLITNVNTRSTLK